MIGRIPVSSRALRRRRIQLDGRVERDVAVFPFFDASGEVPFCMAVPRQGPRLHFFAPREARPRVPVWGTIRFEGPPASRSDGDDGPALDGLWHYDPDWLLCDASFADNPITPAVRRTNCARALPADVTRLYFRRDLTRVRGVLRGPSDSPRIVTLDDVLPPDLPGGRGTSPSSRRPRQVGSWRLDPIWMRTAR